MIIPSRLALGALCIVAIGLLPPVSSGAQRAAGAAIPAAPPAMARVAFASKRDGDWEIYVTDADGTRETRLTRRDGQDRFPVWSPGATRIAFGSEGGGKWELRAEIAFVSDRDGNREIYLLKPDGRGLERVTADPAADHVPVWSPDGSRIAIQAVRGDNYDIEVVRVASRARARLTADPSYDGLHAWSSDGTRLAFISGRDGVEALYSIGANGGPALRLTESASLNPSWSS